MIDGLYLSEAVDLNQLQRGKLNLISTNCGSGKSYFAINNLAGLATNYSNVVYLTDTTAMRDMLAKEPNCKVYDPLDRDILNGKIINFEKGKIIVMTYHKMGILLKYNPNLFDGVEILICDELHKVPEYIEIEKRKNKKLFRFATEEEQDFWLTCSCSCYFAANFIEQMASGIKINELGDIEAVENPKLVVGLSATPQKAFSLFANTINKIRINAQLVAYETFKTIYYTDLASTIRNLEYKKVLFYVPFIKDIQSSVKLARGLGYKAEGIWSLNNEKYRMSEEQLRIREYILTNQELPPEYDFIFINQAYETAINIRGEIDCIVVHTTDPDKREQARNRYRGDLQCQILLANNEEK